MNQHCIQEPCSKWSDLKLMSPSSFSGFNLLVHVLIISGVITIIESLYWFHCLYHHEEISMHTISRHYILWICCRAAPCLCCNTFPLLCSNVALWLCSSMFHWLCCHVTPLYVAMWLWCPDAQWLFCPDIQLLCSHVAPWLCGSVVMWLYVPV